jgi:hypothetical protein
VYRHGAIKARLLARIASTDIGGQRPLDALGTRDDDDPAIALIDAFSGAMHILAWNAARLADDASIRRTEDRDALVDLTRLLGYTPRPALSATTTLSFTLDAFAGAPGLATIPKGTKVTSVPGPGEKPQIFETDAALDARAEWNTLTPVQHETVVVVDSTTASITITGALTTAKPGDLVLVYLEPHSSSGTWLCARVAHVTRDPGTDPPSDPARTVIDLAEPATLSAPKSMQDDKFKNQVVILGQRAAPFGATAPDITLMPTDIQTNHGVPEGAVTEWDGLTLPGDGKTSDGTVDLDAVYPDAISGRFLVFRAGGTTQTGFITSSSELSRHGFGLSAKVSRVVVEGIDLTTSGFFDKVRETTIYIETARETLLVSDADVAMPGSAADRITVQGSVILPVGRSVVLSGEQWSTTTGPATQIAEVAVLKSATATADGNTEFVFDNPVANSYRSTKLSLLANAVGASQGETPATGAEIIGSSVPATLAPRFPLSRSPLTYVPATTLRGYAPAIEVRVSERLYTEVPTLFGLSTADQAYTVTTGRDDISSVQFAGRLPSGTHNVTALYRTGAGAAGNVAAGRLTTILTPVVGVGKAANPVRADGGSDAETIEDMRIAAPQSIRTLDRVVSLADFEAFARGYRGVGKALATELLIGMRSVVCLTIATTTLDEPSVDLANGLRSALTQVAAPGRAIRIEGFSDLTAQVTIALAIDPMLIRSNVEAAVRSVLGQRFGRAARQFGEALHRSAVLAAVQQVDGVVASTLPVFLLVNGPPENEGRLLCPPPAMVGDTFVKAGLLSIDADAVQFTEMNA